MSSNSRPTAEQLEQLTVEQLLELGDTDTSEPPLNRSRFYRVAHDKCKAAGREADAEVILSEILVFDLYTGRAGNARFVPQVVWKAVDGSDVPYPNLQTQFPPKSIEYYRRRASETRNPISRARYGDVVWEFIHDADCARLAVEAHIECCPIYFRDDEPLALIDSLGRAVKLSAVLRDRVLGTKIASTASTYMRKLTDRADFGLVSWILDAILAGGPQFGKLVDYEELIGFAEHAIKASGEAEKEPFHIQRCLMKSIAEIRGLQKDGAGRRMQMARLAESYAQEAEWKAVNYLKGNTVAAHYYEKALQVYADLGGYPDRVTALKLKIQQANEKARETDFTPMEVEMELTEELRKGIDEHVAMYKGRSAGEAFAMLATDQNIVPSFDGDLKLAQKHNEESGLSKLFTHETLRGRIRVKSTTREAGIVENNAISMFQMDYQMRANVFLRPAMRVILKEHAAFAEELTNWLSKSGTISAARIGLMLPGIQAFVRRDYVNCIHTLVFQIEGAAREMLDHVNVPTFTRKRNEMREIELSGVLSALREVGGMDVDFLKFMEIFLCDLRGGNLRNDVAHGLLEPAGFTVRNAVWLIYILVRLASYRVQQDEGSTREEGEKEVSGT